MIYLSTFNIFLSITAVLGNTLILVVLRKESSLHPPSKLLFRCLALSDLCVRLIAQPLSVAYWMSLADDEWNLCRFALASSFMASRLLFVQHPEADPGEGLRGLQSPPPPFE